MQTDWLIDFTTLAETRSFSRAAQRRHITQPAFSRRIRALEHWADATLIDRGHPPQLTPAGRMLLERVPELTAAMQRTQDVLRAQVPARRDVLAFAATPELACGFFPGWITGQARLLDRTPTSMTVLEPTAALQHLLDGHCDLLLMHACDELPLGSQAAGCEHLALGHERLLPCTRAPSGGTPRHALAGSMPQAQPYLAHAPDARMARAIELALRRGSPLAPLRPVFECNSSEALKAMARAGMGIAFLPEHCVRADLEQGLLVPAGEPLDLVLEIRLLRRRARAGARPEPLPWRFWKRLREQLTRRSTTAPMAPDASAVAVASSRQRSTLPEPG